MGVVLLEGVGLWLLPAQVRGVWAPTLQLGGVDDWMVLARVLGRQGRALGAPLQSQPAPEHVRRTQAFDGAEAAQRASDEVARQRGEEHARGGNHRLPSLCLHLLRFGLERDEGAGEGGEVRGEGHGDGQDGRLQGAEKEMNHMQSNQTSSQACTSVSWSLPCACRWRQFLRGPRPEAVAASSPPHCL